MRATSMTIVALLLALVLAGTGLAATGSQVSGVLEVPDSATLQGQTSASLTQGVFHLRADDLQGTDLQLDADRLELSMTWEKGYRARVLGEDTRSITEDGTETRTFEDARLTLQDPWAQPEVLAILNETSSAEALAMSTSSLSVDILEDAYLTQVEFSEETVSQGGQAPGFWYHVDGPWAHLSGLETTQVTGDFDLFLNNVSLEIQDASGTWETWTGYREDPEGAPAAEYETRVTVLHVRGGQLSVDGAPSLSLLGERIQTQVDGTIEAPQVRGELLGPEVAYAFDRAPLRLEGSGSLAIQAAIPGGQASGALQQDAPAKLRLAPQGQYTVHKAPGIVEQPRAEASALPGPDAAWISVAALVAVGLLALLITRTSLLQAVDKVRADLRERRVQAWMRTGDRLTAVRDYEKALGWYQRITRKYPTYAEAWYAQGVTSAELGDHEQASKAYEVANDLLGGDDPELIDLAAQAAWKGGLEGQARKLWCELAHLDPARLQQRFADPSMREVRHQPWARKLLGDDKTEVQASYA